MPIPISTRYMLDEIAGLDRHKTMLQQPLVSIGIPTFNRAEGLRRTLACISGQTYRNIEIIVSDNCSPGNEVKHIAETLLQHDKRITYFRQNESLGIAGNFKFVLGKATGDYFMWAADDDEWSADFIEQCLKILQQDGVVSVMSHFDIAYRFDDRRESGRVPRLSIENTKAQNALAFLSCVTPSLFYGLHKRSSIGFFLQDDFFDFYDCYFMFRLTLTGRVAVIEPCLYTAGVDAPTYQVKPAKKHRFTRLQYSPLLFKSVRQIISSPIKIHEKVSVMLKLICVVISLFFCHEIKRVLQ